MCCLSSSQPQELYVFYFYLKTENKYGAKTKMFNLVKWETKEINQKYQNEKKIMFFEKYCDGSNCSRRI